MITDTKLFQKAGFVWTGLDEGGDEQGGAADRGATGAGAGGAVAGGAALGGISQWMALMAEHMSHDQTRLPFLWPKLNTGNHFIEAIKMLYDVIIYFYT